MDVTLITRAGCHLCAEAFAVLERVVPETGAKLRVIDFDAAEPGTLPARYGAQLPVTLIDGREHDHFMVDEGRLRAALTRASTDTGAGGGSDARSGRTRRWFGSRR